MTVSKENDRRLRGVQNPRFQSRGGEKRMRIRQPTQSLQLPGQFCTRQTQSKPIQIDSCRAQFALQVVRIEEFVQGEQTGRPAVLLRQLAGQERFPRTIRTGEHPQPGGLPRHDGPRWGSV